MHLLQPARSLIRTSTRMSVQQSSVLFSTGKIGSTADNGRSSTTTARGADNYETKTTSSSSSSLSFSFLSSSPSSDWTSWQAHMEQSSSQITNSTGDDKTLTPLMDALVKMRGHAADYVPNALIFSLCDTYPNLSTEAKQRFYLFLARDLHTNHHEVDMAMHRLREADQSFETSGASSQRLHKTQQALRARLVPVYERLFHHILASREDGMAFLLSLRQDMLQLRHQCQNERGEAALREAMNELEGTLKTILTSWFSRNLLQLQRITFDSPGSLLEKIINYEAVHPVTSLAELKRRLGSTRRCFALFHPAVLPSEPLVFVHVALTRGLASGLASLSLPSDTTPDTAMFYSISSTQPGLSGVDLGNFLIKQVVKSLSVDLPHVTTYSTLSPIPQFIPWLRTKLIQDPAFCDAVMTEDAYECLLSSQPQAPSQVSSLNEITTGFPRPSKSQLLLSYLDQETLSTEVESTLRSILMPLGHHYLVIEKRRGKALCSVANFHLRNGACLQRLNWGGDRSAKGWCTSGTLMVNYQYTVEAIERNNAAYVLHHTIILGTGMETAI